MFQLRSLKLQEHSIDILSIHRSTRTNTTGTVKIICPGPCNFLSLVQNFEKAGISLDGPLQRMLAESNNQKELTELQTRRNDTFSSWWPVVEWYPVWKRFESVNAKMFMLEDISGQKYTNYPEPLTIVRESYAAREALSAIRKIISSVEDGEIPTYEDLMDRVRALFDQKILTSIDHATRSILRYARVMRMSKLEDKKKGIQCRST